MDASLESSPQSKRHSFPAILTYSETLSVLSEHQRQYNDKELTQRCNTPTINSKGSDEERRQKLQQAMEWLKQELKDMYHQDKFLLRQFNHLNRSIQDLKDKQEIPEERQETEMRQLKQSKSKEEPLKQAQLKQEQLKNGQLEQIKPKKEQLKHEFKLEDLEQAQIKQAQLRREQLKQEELKLEETKQEKRSLNEYDSDYGSDQSMDKFEEDCQSLKNNVILNVSPKAAPKQRTIKRWTWWK